MSDAALEWLLSNPPPQVGDSGLYIYFPPLDVIIIDWRFNIESGMAQIWGASIMKNVLFVSRRDFVKTAAGTVMAASVAMPWEARSATGSGLPTAPVGITRCRRYDYELVRMNLGEVFSWIGDIPSLVAGKRVTVKVNCTGSWNVNTYTLPVEYTVFTNPNVVLAACSLFKEYGASSIVIADSMTFGVGPRDSFKKANYDVNLFEAVVPGIQWEDTHNVGSGKDYSKIEVGSSGYLYGYFKVNHVYSDTDVQVSIAKMKNHQIAGITLGMKNQFGVAPNSLYAGSTVDENATSNRAFTFHSGGMSAAGGEILPYTSTDPGFRVPRVVADMAKARPIHLTITDAIVTMHGGEGQWETTSLGITVPGLLIAGTNVVCTDAVTASVMGYDPEGVRGTKPFMNGDNHIALAAGHGLGTNRLSEIEVKGLSIAEARYQFQPVSREQL